MAGEPCVDCGAENPDGARFCMGCGMPLARRCRACGEEAPARARFCGACGTALEAPVATATEPDSIDERRHVTVLFADLTGSTALAERMDPESVKSLVGGALRRLAEEVVRYGGSVDKYIGDNVMALFGAPVAHEDDEERAVRAALGMQAAMAEVNAGLPDGVHFALRVGLNTGEVVAGHVGGGYTVMGDTVNVAARLQAAARPGTVVAGERTVRGSRGAVRYTELQRLRLKGKSEPVAAWEAQELTAEHAVRRVQSDGAPLFGRDHELSTLESLYARVVGERRPHLVTLVGEAGVGKSRVLREFEDRLRAQATPPALRTGRCLPYGAGVVYWALGEVIRAEYGIEIADSAEEAWGKLAAALPERHAAIIGSSLGLDVPADALAGHAEDPQRARDELFLALRATLETVAADRPLVVVFEDIHWADDGMLDAIEHLAQWVRAPLLLICLTRGELLERRPAWGGGRRNGTQLFLEPLGDEETRALIEALLPGGGEVVQAVAERCGGNPLFVEEMVRRVAEDGGEAAELPDTVQAVLAARLDALEPRERRVVQQAAVIGRTFWISSLAALLGDDERELEPVLTGLQEKDVLAVGAERRHAGERELGFRHVLIRDVAYGMLPRATRARKHFEVGCFIEERAGDRSDEVVALLAEHFGRALSLGAESGLPAEELEPARAQALRFLEEAGDAAARLYSNREAAAHYQRALEVAADDAVTRVRVAEKLGDVALRLGRVDAALDLWQSALDHHRGEEDLQRVADLHRKLGAAASQKGERRAAIEHYQTGINMLKDGPPRPELVRLYEEAAWLYLHTGENMLAIYAAEKALRLAERLGETSAASRAHGIFGRVFGRIGDNEKARTNLERSVELARGADDGETVLALLALGRHREISEADADGARAAYAEGLALAERVGDLPVQVELHAAQATLAAYRADWEELAASAAASARLVEREGLVGKLCLPQALRGFECWREGRLDEAAGYYREAHRLAEQAGWSEVSFQSLYGLAVALRDAGDPIAAATALDQAIDVCERAGLIAQSIQAMTTRAEAHARAGRTDGGRDSAAEAAQLAERVRYPLAAAAALEARGATAADPTQGADLLAEAEAAWSELDRPLEATRCRFLAGEILAEADPARSQALLGGAAERFRRLGVPHLAEQAAAAS